MARKKASGRKKPGNAKKAKTPTSQRSSKTTAGKTKKASPLNSRATVNRPKKRARKSDHKSIEVSLNGHLRKASTQPKFAGEILIPLSYSRDSELDAGSVGVKESPGVVNLDLFRGDPISGTGQFVDAWYSAFGTSTLRALISGIAGIRLSDLMAEAIINNDDRQRIEETTRYPFGAICSLEITADSGRLYTGTGWLIDPVTVATSGHCIFMKHEGGWANSIRVYPGRNGPKSPEAYFAKTLMSVQGWVRESAPDCDYGAIRLDSPVPDVGTFGFRTDKDSALARYNCHVVGYPADKQGEMWGQIRRLKNVSDETLYYDGDAWGSMSGAPVFVVENGNVLSIGINNSGDLGGSTATRITDRVFKNLESWKDSEK